VTAPVLLSVALEGFPPLPNVARRAGSWHQRADDARTWRGAAYLAALEALRESLHPEDFPLRRAVVELVVLSPDMRVGDPDGCVSACKPVFDGIVQAGVLRGDSFTTIGRLSVRHEVGPKGLRVDVLYGTAA
jgi:hypothetical protein